MTKRVVGKNVWLALSLRLRKCSGNNNNAAVSAAPPPSAIFCQINPRRTKDIATGRSTAIEASQKLGFAEASRIELNTAAIPYATEAAWRPSTKKQAVNWMTK
jgi:hypothetical protein